MSLTRRQQYLAAIAGSVALATTLSAAPAVANGDDSPKLVASGLNSPRHLSMTSSGDLYVAESGVGGDLSCVTHPELGEFCFGFTGSITHVRDNGPDRQVVTGLPSIASEFDALGPMDVSITGNTYVASIGLGGSDELREAFGPDGALLGTLVTGKLHDDSHSLFADVLANEAAANPDGTDIDSNPTGILRQGDGFLVADSGGNALVRTNERGVFSTVTALPPGSALAPDFLGLPPGTQIPTDAVPTAVVRGPDGALYISQLTGFPFEKGDSSIWRIRPGHDATIYASGLTNVTDLAFGKDGSLYAVQIAKDGLLSTPEGELPMGSLVKVRRNGMHKTVADDLAAPYGVALTSESAYVSTCTVCPGGGEVWRIPLD